MNNLIACCGLDCQTCDARIATINNDDNLRKETAEKWKVQHNIPDISFEMINCMGCREEGVKIGHCSTCEIRSCATSKGFSTCGDCSSLENCSTVAGLHQFLPETKSNLLHLK